MAADVEQSGSRLWSKCAGCYRDGKQLCHGVGCCSLQKGGENVHSTQTSVSAPRHTAHSTPAATRLRLAARTLRHPPPGWLMRAEQVSACAPCAALRALPAPSLAHSPALFCSLQACQKMRRNLVAARDTYREMKSSYAVDGIIVFGRFHEPTSVDVIIDHTARSIRPPRGSRRGEVASK